MLCLMMCPCTIFYMKTREFPLDLIFVDDQNANLPSFQINWHQPLKRETAYRPRCHVKVWFFGK